MPTPSIQTLTTDAQQVLNLDSISAVRSVVAVALANANTGTPLNPNLTTQQLWDQFYQVVTRPKSDIESIIANQLMKFLYAPPAPGGAGADKQVIFNDGGVLAGDADFLWNKTTNLLTVTGSATISGDLTVDTNVLKVDTTNNRVGIGTASPALLLDVNGSIQTASGSAGGLFQFAYGASASSRSWRAWNDVSANGDFQISTSTTRTGSTYSDRYRIDVSGVHEWSNTSGLAMTLNSTGLGVGGAPLSGFRLNVNNGDFRVSDNQNEDGVELGWSAGAGSGFVQVYNRTTSAFKDLVLNNAATITASGNVGIGVTPSAWSNSGNIDLANGFIGISSSGIYGGAIANNAYYNAGWKYKAANYANLYLTGAGEHKWLNAPVGAAAGNAITFTQAMTLDASGRLIINSSTFIPPTLNTNGDLNFIATSNTNVRFSYRGTDGVTRVANITLA